MVNSYVIGNVIRVSVSFTDSEGGVADPTSVRVHFQDPSGIITQYPATKDSAGKYHYDFMPATDGLFRYRFEGLGQIVAATQGLFTVIPAFA